MRERGGDTPGGRRESDRPSTRPAIERRQETILVVDDNDLALSVTTSLLEAAGYAVIPCPSAVSALETCRGADVRIDLLLTDLVLPDMSGEELAARVVSTRPRTPVIFTSGYLGGTLTSLFLRDDNAVAQLFGPRAFFLQKPFDQRELLRAVSRALELGGEAGSISR